LSLGKPNPLPELTVQYADYAAWQRQRFSDEVKSTHLAYWEKKLANLTFLQLPIQGKRSPKATFKGSRQYFELSENLTQKLKLISRQEGVTLFVTLAAAINTLFYRYSAQEDICIGTVMAERDRPEVQGIIGEFLNTLVLRTDLKGNPSFRELLKRVREVTLEAKAHRDLPFDKLVAALKPDRQGCQNPLFSVAFVLQPTLLEEKLGWKITQPEVHSQTSKFDLSFSLEERSGIIGYIEYSTELFDIATIERTHKHFITLLEGIVTNPDQHIAQLPLLTEAERHQLLVEWNNTTTEYPLDKCIHQLFESQSSLTPDALAVVYENQQLTYQQLNCRANQLAHYLRALGVGPEVLVGICVERSLEMVVGLLGILKAGGAYVPLDSEYPQQRLSFMLEDAAVSVLLTQQHLVERLPEYKAQFVCLDTDWQVISQSSEENPITGVQATNLAYVIYTSGSTGQPKGVAMNHFPLCNLILWQLQNTTICSGAKTLQFAPVSFDVSFQEMFSTWCSGGTLLLIAEELRRDPLTLLGLLEEKAVERLFLPFVGLQQLAEVATGSELVTSNLREIITAGEQLQITPAISSWLSKLIGCTLHNHYGPSESHVVTTFTLTNSVDNWPTLPPIGRPIANTQVYILDSHLQPVPIGVPGELHIGGAPLARGYLNARELTQEKFILNPFSADPHSRLYKTGDLTRYLADGNIEYLGRIDNQVKVRGFRVELGEIEAVLRQHPQVYSVVVIDRQDTPGDQRLVAYIVPQQDTVPTINELRQFLKTRLPNYMVPNVIVMLESLPLTPNGKVDRRALPAPDTNNEAMQANFVPPQDIVEQKLVEIWAEVLNVYPVGVKDNFFDLGGHSLLAVRLMARIEQQFKKNLPLATLFQNSTIQQLATILRQPIDALNWSALVPIQPNGSKRPFFCVPGVGGTTIYLYNLAHHLGKDQPFYGLQSLGLDGESKPHTQIEDMAAYYIEAIQSIQPKGPYLLGGHSFGGLVAFEMATQLHKQGYEVALLALFDSGEPGYITNELDFDNVDDAGSLNMIASRFESIYGKSLNVSSETLKVLDPLEQLNYFKQQLQMVNLLPPDVGIKQLQGIMQVFKTNDRSASVYMPQAVYPAQITYFQASEIDAVNNANSEILDEAELGWNKFSSQPLDIHLVPGDHITMLNEPHVQVLAQQLTICIERSQADD
jgi:amino acid adenylation domain-containing protein